MSGESVVEVAALAEVLDCLTINVKGEQGEEAEEVVVEKDTEDDGYRSGASEEKSEGEPDEGTPEEEQDDDEEILQPLSIAPTSFRAPTKIYISRGPIDHETHYNRGGHPYTRGGHTAPPVVLDSYQLPPVSLLVLRKADTRVPARLEAQITWSNKHELCIEKHLLPEDTYFGEESLENKVQLFIQLNPKTKDLKSFLADVKTEFVGATETKRRFIGPIVISLKTELAESTERRLLDMTTMEERTAAYNLVQQKELTQLTSGIGPHKDTVLSVLCAKRNHENRGQTYAQIHAVIQRLINHQDNVVKRTIFRLNNNQISAFEIAAITNNSLVACYLAEVMYNISEDTRSALRALNCKDTQGNTILHLLARKGDSNLNTMRDLLNIRLTDGTKVFTMTSNSKKQFPMHIATQNIQNQPETIRLLYQHMPRAFEVLDDDGMTALHYACQRTTDRELIATVLSYKKDNINIKTKDGLTALDLVSRRCRTTTQTYGLFAIEPQQQADITKMIRNNGGKSNMLAEQEGGIAIGAANMGYVTASCSSPLQGLSPECSEGSPYSHQSHQSSVHSPHTPPLGSPCSLSQHAPSMNSVGSFPRSSPDSTPVSSPAYQASPLYQVSQ